MNNAGASALKKVGLGRVFAEIETRNMHLSLLVALVPLLAWATYSYGWTVWLMTLSTILGGVVGDYWGQKLGSKPYVPDLQIFVWGGLLALSCPPQLPFFLPGLILIPGVFISKFVYGGRGGYWIHPVALVWVVLALSWGSFFESHLYPAGLGVDTLSGATPLQLLSQAASEGARGGGIQLLGSLGYPVSASDVQLTGFFNNLLAPLNINLPKGYFDLFWGHVPGAMGESSSLLLLILSVFLLGSRTIRWEIPAFGFLSFSLLTFIFGGLPFQEGLFAGDVLFHLLSGGFLFVLFFMAPEPVTTPLTREGLILFGVGFGLFTFIFRIVGASPGGCGFALLIMNLSSPVFDYFYSKKFKKS